MNWKLKTERRGKYGGEKLHLDAEQCKVLLGWHQERKFGGNTNSSNEWAVEFTKAVAKSIKDLLKEHPDMLEERTPEQIKEALLRDKAKIEKQLAAGKDWKSVE
ncbi:MAG: hypothetical protein AB7J46_06765 [Candidatus Altimarinota bacterium]